MFGFFHTRPFVMSFFRPAFLVLLFLLAHPSAANTDFYSRSGEGWFWYNVPLIEPEPDIPTETPPEPPPVIVMPTAPPAEPTSPPVDEPPPFSVVWLKEKLPEYHNRAIDDPTRENVAAYLYLQRVALDKAETFQQVAQRTVTLDPLLDENVRRPIASFASRQVDARASISARKTLADLATDTGLFFFFRSDCPYCEIQAPIIRSLAQRYGFNIIPISLDNRPLPSGLFPDFRTDQGQAEALGVIATPAMFLARAPNHFAGLGQGALDQATLERRILSAAADAGWIDQRALQAARPVRNELKLTPPSSTPLPSLSGDPAAMVDYLRSQAKGWPSL